MTASRDEMQRMLQSVQKVIRARTVGATDSRSLEHHHGPSIGGSKRRGGPSSLGDDDDDDDKKRTDEADTKKMGETALNAKDNETEFVKYYYRVIRSFIEDKSKYKLELPDLSGFDRRVVHALAEKCNLSHSSVGEGEQRVLQLKKDVLFFHNPDVVRSVDLDDVLAKACGKESKFHLRYARRVDPAQLPAGAIGSYADEDALRKIERLRRATDEYRHATEMGYTQEELMAQENGTDPTALLLSSEVDTLPQPTPTPMPMLSESALTKPVTAAEGRAVDPPAEGRRGEREREREACAAVTRCYDEVCRGCGARATVDYAISRWVCSKYCAVCMRRTIWNLCEVSTPEEERVETVAMRKQEKLEQAQAEARADTDETPPHDTRAVEEIDHEEDDPITVEDVVEMAAMNDFAASDVNWLRRFATLHAGRLNESVVFCIDFYDLCELRIFRRYAHPAARSAGRTRCGAAGEELDVCASDRAGCEPPANGGSVNQLLENDDGKEEGVCDEVTPARRRRRIDAEQRSGESAFTDEPVSRYRTSVCYAVVRESRALQRSLTSLLEEVIRRAFVPLTEEAELDRVSVREGADGVVLGETSTDDARRRGGGVCSGLSRSQLFDVHTARCMEHVGLAFSNTSVYGVEAMAVCQLRPRILSHARTGHAADTPAPSVMRLDVRSLEALQREYGETHCYIADTLDDALSHTS